MKKRRFFGCILVGLCFLLGACQASSVKDPDAEIKQAAAAVIENLNTGEYEAIFENANDMLQEDLSPTELEALFREATNGIGDFEEITDHIIDQSDDEITDIAVVRYENGELRFTLGFDQELKLCYIYIK